MAWTETTVHATSRRGPPALAFRIASRRRRSDRSPPGTAQAAAGRRRPGGQWSVSTNADLGGDVRILYGIVGEGMGHATRSRVVLEHLLSSGHEVLVVVSGRAHKFLTEKFKNRPSIRIEEIYGLHLVMQDGELDKSETLLSNLREAPKALRHNLEAYRKVAASFDAQAVVSDFESWAYFYARTQDLPVISIDNMQILNRCEITEDLTLGEEAAFRVAKYAVKAKLPGAYHYLITSFFFPRVKKPRTTLVPPILREDVLRAQRMPGGHILVYQTGQAGASLLPQLKRLPGRFIVYGAGREGEEGNVLLRPFSEKGFIQDLRTAKAVVASAGFSLMSEAVHLRVPMLAVPVAGQFEQELNARALDKLGYGHAADHLDEEVLSAFFQDIPNLQNNLESYPAVDNGMTFACLDELLRDISVDEPPPDVVEAEARGKYDPHPLLDDDAPR